MAYLGYFEVLLAYVFFVLFYIIRRNTGVPINWPLIGMLPSTLRYFNSLHEGLTEILGRTGGTFPIKGPWLANMDTVATADPANVHHVMSANFPNFPKGGDFLKIFEVLGNGIFNADEDMWKRQRKLARVLINHRRFHQFLLKTSRCKVVDGLIPFLDHFSERGMTVDFQEMFQRLTFDTTCILVTGYDPGCLSIDLPEVQFAEAMDAAEEAILVRHILPQTIWKLQRWLGLGHEKKLTKAWETLDRVIGKYITMKREELSKKEKTVKKREEEEEAADLLTSYMIEDDEELGMGLKRDDKFLRDTVLNLMLAGRDTVSSCLTWFFLLVSQNPKVEGKIRDELKTMIPGEDANRRRIFDAQEVTNLVYLHGALCEALRLYPPVPFQHKEAVQEDILPSGHRVPAKTRVTFSMYAMGRMKFVWGDDCLEFKPQRWISEQGTIKHEPSYKFFAFNAGPRTCIGKEVAFTQMKVVAATIIHNYDVQVVEGHSTKPNTSIILYMKHGFKVRVQKRWF